MDPALLLVAGLAIILLLQFSRVRRQQREVRATQAAVEVGAEVLTASGMIGTVVETTGATVTLAGADGSRHPLGHRRGRPGPARHRPGVLAVPGPGDAPTRTRAAPPHGPGRRRPGPLRLHDTGLREAP